MAAAVFCAHRVGRLDIELMPRLLRAAVALLVPALLSPAVLAGQHSMVHAARDSLSVMAIGLGTTVSPALNGRARSEVLLTQPMVSLRGARFGSALQYVGMLNFERWTMPDGEPVAGIWGEGFIDRRHPHTVVHEAMVTGNLTRGPARVSLSAGKGFVPFGTDDPMVRPFVKYPANHHHSQIMERMVVVASARIASSAAIELAAYNGDEPLSPTAAPQWNRIGDSQSARLTLWPRDNVEVQASVAAVRSPDFVRAEGLDHRKLNASIRYSRAGPSPRYILAEWARTDERTAGRSVVAYGTALAEALIGMREWSLAARVEQTSRPEDERLLDPFRTTRPPNHLTLNALTRWRIGTLHVARPLTNVRGVHSTLFAEVSRARSSPLLTPVLASPRDISGADAAWHVSAGVRVGSGRMSFRAGRYGAAAGPASANLSLGMPHAPRH
jgi:hypothetical protein